VLRFATELRQSGIDVILDKWDLREGHDAHAFMEKMVTDPEIKKVVLICDRTYVEKADGRSGGVGTEAQIISGEIYRKQTQDKFVAVVTERDQEGRPYLPAYYRSRIYVDLSDPSAYSESFDQLLRWAYDQPFYKKPDLGTKPSFLSAEKEQPLLATSSRFRRAVDAIKNGRNNAQPFVAEYFACLSTELEKLRIASTREPFDDAVIESIAVFLPYRDEAIELFLTLAVYCDSPETRTGLHRFFEQLIPYLDRPQHVSTWHERDFDNFRFIVHELFLYAMACLIRHERFESAAYLMSNDYYIAGRSDLGRDAMVQFAVFRQHTPSLQERNGRLKLQRLSLRADLLEKRCIGLGIEFRHLMQADFVLFLRGCLPAQRRSYWFPETLLYAGRQAGPFEVFARSRSTNYFTRAKVLLGIDAKEDLQSPLAAMEAGSGLPQWQYESFSPAHLLGFNEIATKP